MKATTRRRWLGGFGASVAGLASAPRLAIGGTLQAESASEARPALALEDFQPRSMLRVAQTAVPRARFPVIDAHTHLTRTSGGASGDPDRPAIETLESPEEILSVMDRKNVRTMVNLTGGNGAGLEQAIRSFDRAFPGRFVTLTEPSYAQAAEDGYPQLQADAIVRARGVGARGLKVLKALGLYLREGVTSGPLVEIDDVRFDPMWEACGAHDMPVFIHVADPEAFFLPTDRFNERYEELSNHPDWSFYGRDFPSRRALLEARNRVVARHPNTRFVGLHVGNGAEDLGYVSECLERYPNLSVEIGARIGELGRQPRAARRFFEMHQDRILFGTDAVPHGVEVPQQIFGDELYEIYYRFLETEDEYFDYAPAPVPPQGRWRIYGLGLPEPILKKVYRDNAARLLGLDA